MRRRSDSLLQRTLAANLLLITATLFAASIAANLDLAVPRGHRQFLILALAIAGTMVVNIVLLRRRFSPLDRLIERMEQIDPADPSGLDAPFDESGVEEVQRLARAFTRLLARIEAERDRTGRMVLRAQEEERGRLARDLHDEANQSLAAITLRLEALRQDAPPELAEDLAETKRLATQAMDELLGLARQLRPTALDDHGLVPALEGQARRFFEQTGIDASLDCGDRVDDLDPDLHLAIYRVAQEALNNVARHSRARRVRLTLRRGNGRVELRVEDDGEGFDSRPRGGGGLGLQGMAERARLAGGDLEVRTMPGEGTLVILRVPATTRPAQASRAMLVEAGV